MSELANTHLRQARSFLRVGDAQRAVELLEKARALARDDVPMLREVTAELADAYAQAGLHERAARCREQVQFLVEPATSTLTTIVGADQATARLPFRRHRMATWKWAIVVIAFLAAHAALYFGYRGFVDRHRAANESSQASQSTQPSIVVAAPESVSLQPATVRSATTASTAPKSAIDSNLQALVDQNVGLVVVMGHYEGRFNGQDTTVEVPLGTGTAFAVRSHGILLTNRHVVDAATNPEIPPTLEQMHMPTVTLRKTSYLVCFGKSPGDHILADPLFRSDNFDVAVLKVNRIFPKPLALAQKAPKLNDDVRVVGYPGAIQSAFNAQYMTEERRNSVIGKLVASNSLNLLDDAFSPESYKPSMTRGIISTAERNIDGAGYTQFDARTRPGNSGGPVLNLNLEVAAIVTLGGRKSANSEDDAEGYNFGLLIEQLRDELAPYLEGKGGK